MSRTLSYETIVKAHEGDLEAVNAVLSCYAGYIRYFSKVDGQVDDEIKNAYEKMEGVSSPQLDGIPRSHNPQASDERYVLKAFYGEDNQYGSNAADDVAGYFQIERASVYRRKNRVLERLTILLIGKA